MDLSETAWFAGFADGEGCFYIARQEDTYVPRFDLNLRSDDLPILLRLRETFGGAVRPVRGKDQRQHVWQVTARRGLASLVVYFDRFPLQAKKARDYAIWREAALLYIRSRTRRDVAGRLGPLREALVACRRYPLTDDELAAADVVEEAAQLVFGEG